MIRMIKNGIEISKSTETCGILSLDKFCREPVLEKEWVFVCGVLKDGI
jgi:hypothetical protein